MNTVYPVYLSESRIFKFHIISTIICKSFFFNPKQKLGNMKLKSYSKRVTEYKSEKKNRQLENRQKKEKKES